MSGWALLLGAAVGWLTASCVIAWMVGEALHAHKAPRPLLDSQNPVEREKAPHGRAPVDGGPPPSAGARLIYVDFRQKKEKSA